MHGVVQTEPGIKDREEVFRIVKDPDFRMALMNNPSIFSTSSPEPEEGCEPAGGSAATEEVERASSNVVEEWRKSAFVDDKMRVTRRAWEVSISMHPGIALGHDGGMPAEEAERAVKDFFDGDAHYREVVEDLLSVSVGITLRFPGDVTAVIVAEPYFDRCVEIGASRLISELPVLV